MKNNDKIRHLTLKSHIALRDYWVRLSAGRAVPVATDFKPGEVAEYMPIVALTDVTHAPLEFRYTQIGQKLVDETGRDATGRKIDEDLYGNRLNRMR